VELLGDMLSVELTEVRDGWLWCSGMIDGGKSEG
jgi:hypothetical protein